MRTGQRHILVVDDDEATRKLLNLALTRAGYKVTLAANGAEALTSLRSNCPDIVLTDWQMPHLDGKELCQKIQVETLEQYVYVIMMTAHNTEVDLIDALDSGAHEYVTKPLAIPELCARLTAAGRILDVERELRRQVSLDPVTSLFNWDMFVKIAAREGDRARRYDSKLSCAMIELAPGAPADDTDLSPDVLRQCAVESLRVLRTSDYIGRYSDTRFCALLIESDEPTAIHVARRWVSALRGIGGGGSDNATGLSPVCGVAEAFGSAMNAMLPVYQADQALDSAIENGATVHGFIEIAREQHELMSREAGHSASDTAIMEALR